MENKFKKDIELARKEFEKTANEFEQERWLTDKDERMWINLYFIGKELNTIKWILILTIGVLIWLAFF